MPLLLQKILPMDCDQGCTVVNTGELYQYSVLMLLLVQRGVWMHCPITTTDLGFLPSNGYKIGTKLLAMKLVKISPLMLPSYVTEFWKTVPNHT